MTAQGEADSRLLLAEAEAKAIKIKGDALRENPSLIELQAVEKWNGVMPTMMLGGGATPFITVPTNK
jgi:regulator of protease activity HflC (stomatin/prohibitin superfamily)